MDRQEEVKTKLQKVRTWLDTAGLEGIVLTSQANFAWLTGGGINYVYVADAAGEASILVSSSPVYLMTNNIEMRRLLEEEVPGLPFQAIHWKWHQRDNAKELVVDLCDLSKAVSDLNSLGLPPAPSGFTQLRHTMLPPGNRALPALRVRCSTVRGDRLFWSQARRCGIRRGGIPGL